MFFKNPRHLPIGKHHYCLYMDTYGHACGFLLSIFFFCMANACECDNELDRKRKSLLNQKDLFILKKRILNELGFPHEI